MTADPLSIDERAELQARLTRAATPVTHPHWCVMDTDQHTHIGAQHHHGDIYVWLIQNTAWPAAKVYFDGHLFPWREAARWSHTLAKLGAAEAAATVKRLGELAEADAVFARPQPAVTEAGQPGKNAGEQDGLTGPGPSVTDFSSPASPPIAQAVA